MTDYDPQPAAAMLHQRRIARQTVLPLPAQVAPQNEQQGAAVQRLLADHFGAARPAGFKIGATARRMQEYLGLAGPAAGFMTASGLLPSGAVVQYADFIKPGVECELAVRLGRDLPPGPCTQAQAAAAVEHLVAGIEIVENRYDDIAVLGTPTLIADQVYHAAAVLGLPGSINWHGLDLSTLAGGITIDGEIRGEGHARDLLGHPFNSLAWLAASPVAAAFGGLKAGQVVMLGSVTPPIWLTGPSSVTVEFKPLPAVTVRLA
ncbi:MAG: fumarylacetoacetate hydrolase family protein [Acetobacteraceae bacterium]|nr:fumarylacetoacetate hydrolase family protein [Acetobacteraceae bacterium]